MPLHRIACLSAFLSSIGGGMLWAAPPAAPTNVRQTDRSPAHLRVEWTDAADNEIGYRVWRRLSGETWYVAGETRPNVTRFDDGGMQESTAYEHRVAAFNADGESAATEAGPATTLKWREHLQPEIIIEAGPTYPAAPSAVPLKSGELLLCYSTGSSQKRKYKGDHTLWLRTSRGGVKEWSPPKALFAGDGKNAFGKPAFARLTDGRIGLGFTAFVVDEQGLFSGRERRFVASSDEGETWSKSVRIGEWSANNHTLIVGDDERLLEVLTPAKQTANVVASDDAGATWRQIGEVRSPRLGEAAIAHLGDGRLVFISRSEWPFYPLSFSTDNGTTWTPPSRLYLGGGDNPPKLVRLPGTDILAAIVHSWYDGRKSKDRRQLASVISRDGGRTWENFRLIGFSPDGTDGYLQHALTFVGDQGYLFYGGGSRLDTNDGDDLRLLRLSKDFFTSTAAWPYNANGRNVATRDD